MFPEVTIGDAVAEGHCIARVENQVMFIKYAAPGDVADVQIVSKKKKFLEGKIIKLHKQSELRREPFCSHYGLCGGCKWQHLAYEEQLKFKQQQVVDAFERIGGITGFEVLPVLGCESVKNYRNKLELTFSNKAWVTNFDPADTALKPALGFHIPGRFDKVLDVEQCHLMPEKVNVINSEIKAYCLSHNFEFFDLRDQHGFMRNVMYRCNAAGEWMVLLSFYENREKEIQEFLEHLKNKFPEIVSLLYVINNKRNDTLTDLEVFCYSGNPYLTEKLGELEFVIQPKSFFQTNTKQAENLYSITKEFAALTGAERVYDLYSGTGSIGLFVADKAREVVGVEYVEDAVKDAYVNKERNGINNAVFFAGDMKDILVPEFFEKQGPPDVIITDPPRDGMHPDVVNCILNSGAEKIVYVSCNPATQARDAKLLCEKYDLVKIKPVDMFPHTHHVENVALFALRK